MKLLILLSSLILVLSQALSSRLTSKKTCHRVNTNNVFYEKEKLVSSVSNGRMLNVDRNTDTLYFIKRDFMDGSSDVGRYELKSNEYKNIGGTSSVYFITVNQTNSEVYFGTGTVLYKYDDVNDNMVPFMNKTMGMAYFGSELFYTNKFYGSLYTYSSGKATTDYGVQNSQISFFIVDKDGDVFYSDVSGVYYEKKGLRQPEQLGREVMFIYPFAADTKGNVYICDNSGVHAVNKNGTVKLTTILLGHCVGLAFDSKDNMIVSEHNAIFKYTPKENGC